MSRHSDQGDFFTAPKPAQPKYRMRRPCAKCESADGALSRSGAHIRVDCVSCGAFQYFASKGEAEDAMREIEGAR